MRNSPSIGAAMPNIASALKAEIERLARKETKRQIAPVRKAATGHRRQIAALKRELGRLDKRIAAAAKAPKTAVRSKSDSVGAEPDVRFQARGLRPLRSRLGLSAAGFARLLGVSQQSVYNWELGNAKPRRSQVAAIAKLRGLGKKEATARLKQIGNTKTYGAAKRRRQRKRTRAG